MNNLNKRKKDGSRTRKGKAVCIACTEEYIQENCPNLQKPHSGGCWICHHGNGKKDDDMKFDMEFDTYYHVECLPDDINSIYEYEGRNTELSNGS